MKIFYNDTISFSGKLSLATLRAYSYLLTETYISKASTGYPAFIYNIKYILNNIFQLNHFI
jgi:hypothetical protein